MYLSEKEFNDLIRRKPQLRVAKTTPPTSSSEKSVLAKLKPKKVKYRNIKVYIYADGFVSELSGLPDHGGIKTVFDSRREYARFLELQFLQEGGKITELKRQVPLIVSPAFEYRGEHLREIVYRADFTYYENGEYVVEDVKGLRMIDEKSLTTSDFNIKWKLLKQRYPEYLFRIY